MIVPKSSVEGVYCSIRDGFRGSPVIRWRAVTRDVDGVREELYWGASQQEAEKARLNWDMENPKPPKKYSKCHTEWFQPKIWADWPASKMSWEEKEEEWTTIKPMPRTTYVREYVQNSWRKYGVEYWLVNGEKVDVREFEVLEGDIER